MALFLFALQPLMATGGESFAAWAKDEGVKKMENVTPELVKEYGQELAEKVKNGEMAASTAQELCICG